MPGRGLERFLLAEMPRKGGDGMGMIYKRGKTFWIKYYRNGKPYRESTKSKKEADAKRLLKKREGEIAQGRLPGVYFDRVKFEELAKDLTRDYRINGKKSLERVKMSLKHLDQVFQDLRVPQITSTRIDSYVDTRLKEGAANGTINRELSALKRALNLGARQTPPKVDRVPYIQMLQEDNVRKGFLEYEDFLALRDALPEYLKGFVTFAYTSGWRKAEITGLTWNRVDRKEGFARLEKGETKNKEGRIFFFDDELKEIIEKQWQARKKAEKLSPHVFPGPGGKDKMVDFRKVWNRACRETGLGYGYKTNEKDSEKWRKKGLRAGPMLHDARRSAVRNMVRAGIPEKVVMTISGHKTRAVFDRYNIVDDQDLKVATQRQQAYLQAQMGTVLGTMAKSGGTVRGTGQAQVVDFIGAGGRNRTDTDARSTGF